MTDEAQARASDPNASVWVSANAGSGKTHALTTRVARLLLTGTSPERILCLTYTKAAASEMAARLYARLGRWAMMDDEALRDEIADMEGPRPSDEKLFHARRLFARAIETPGGLKIQTIHAFCESLLGRFPLEAGVPPNFQILDERSAADLQRDVRNGVLMRAMRSGGNLGEALSYIAGRIDEKTFGDLLQEVTGRRGIFNRLLEIYGDTRRIIAVMRNALMLGEEETPASIREDFFAPEQFPESGLRDALDMLLQSGTKTDGETAEKLARILEAAPDMRVPLFDAYMSLFLTDKHESRKNIVTKKHGGNHPATVELLTAEQGRVEATLKRLKAAQVAQSSEAIFVMADEILSGYEEAKQHHAMLDYDDLIERTRDLLLGSRMAPWVLYKLDGGVDHILVDEAQDTSPDQWQIIAAIAEEFLSGAGARPQTRTIFAVGDEKQSIFSFQGADPRRFDEMRRHFERKVKAAELVWDPVRLVRSFRSVPEVLRAVDIVFAQAGARQGLSASGEVDAHVPTRALEAGLVELWDMERPDPAAPGDAWDAPLDYVGEADPRARLAVRIADTIKGWLDRKEWLASKNRPITEGDILILVRRRDAFVSEMIRQLKVRNIAVAGMDRMVLTEQIAVMDLMAVGHFVLLPDDDLNLATLLKTPLVGLSENEVFELAVGRKATLWQELQRRAAESEVFSKAHDLLSGWLARADFVPPYEFFAQLLGEGEGRRKLLARLGPDANDPIDEFLAMALEFERDHAPGLQGFLHWLEASGAVVKRDMEKADEVRVMTVHGAKGLEAEIVFMPDTCAVMAAQHDPHLIELPSEPKMLLWPVRKRDEDEVSAVARELWRAAQQDEYRRLLYVAMTRARDRLYIAGYQGTRALSPDCWYELAAAALKPEAQEMRDEAGRIIWRIEGKTKTTPEQGQTPAPSPSYELPPFAVSLPAPDPTPSRPLAPSRLPPDGQQEPPPFSPLAAGGAQRFLRGRLIHRLLQSLPDLDEAARADAARRFLEMRAGELDGQAKGEILRTTLAVLENPGFAPLFAQGSRAEAAIVGRIDWQGREVVVSGQVDRLCLTSDSVMIVDYKTNRPPPVTLEGVSHAYLGQMAAYRAVLRQIYPNRDVKCALLWTDGPTLMELPGALLDVWAAP